MPIANSFVVKTHLDQKHGENTVETDVEGNGAVDDNFAPEGAFLRIDDDGKDRGDLQRKYKPALGFLKLDESGGHGHTGS